MTIRPARAADAAAISALHEQCVPDLFAGLLGDYVPPAAERHEREQSWTGPIGAPRARHAVLVTELDGDVVGFCAVSPTPDDDDDAHTTGQLRTIMVEPARRGLGVGAALLAAGETALRGSDFAAATLWVVRENARARRCYERGGWHPDGAEQEMLVGGREVCALRYRKRLAR